MSDNVRFFYPPGYYVRQASLPWEMEGMFDLRRRVFVDEQGIFNQHDRDRIDASAAHLVAISTYAHEAYSVVGTVRIHEPEPGIWWGSRLAVDTRYRKEGRLGTELIRLAVRSANAQGCETFFAHVQMQNVVLFQRMHWHALEEVEFHGMPHMRMAADLDHYPPETNPKLGWYHKPLRAAA